MIHSPRLCRTHIWCQMLIHDNSKEIQAAFICWFSTHKAMAQLTKEWSRYQASINIYMRDVHKGITEHIRFIALQWRHTGRDSLSNHQPHDCLLNRLFRRRSKKTSKLRVTGLCVWGIHRSPVNSPHKWPVTRKMFPFDDVIMMKSLLGNDDGDDRCKSPGSS